MSAKHPGSTEGQGSALPADEAIRINYIHEALRSTFRIEELYRVLAATLLTRSAMGFSRAVLFRWDKPENIFRGFGFFGAADASTHEDQQREIVEEQKALAQSSSISVSPLPEDATDEETLFLHSPDDVRRSNHWQSIAKRCERPPRRSRAEKDDFSLGWLDRQTFLGRRHWNPDGTFQGQQLSPDSSRST